MPEPWNGISVERLAAAHALLLAVVYAESVVASSATHTVAVRGVPEEFYAEVVDAIGVLRRSREDARG